MKSKIRWGIIGCGDVTEVKSGPGFQKSEGSELIAVMRRNGKLAEDYARRHNVPKWYYDANKLINDPDVDAVYIATPPSTHKEYTIAVASAGKPVYVEKPMALNYHECTEMVEVCRKYNVPLFVAYYRRALPRFLKVKSLLEDNRIGEVRSVSIKFFQQTTNKDLSPDNWRVDPSIAGCGYFCDLGSHMIDQFNSYLVKLAMLRVTLPINQNYIKQRILSLQHLYSRTESVVMVSGRLVHITILMKQKYLVLKGK